MRNALRLLIVDDEPLIRFGIREWLTNVEDLEIVAECGSVLAAVETIELRRPNVVFLDIHLLDGSGLDVVRRVSAHRMPLVIFVTAYDQYAIQAFEVNAVDYLLKPFDEDRLQQSLDRARNRLINSKQTEIAARLEALVSATEAHWPERLVVRNREHYEFVEILRVNWIESADNYVKLHSLEKTYLLSETMSALETKLNPQHFLRIHRCRMVNLSRVLRVYPLLNGTFEIEITGGRRLTTGKQYRTAVQNLIGRKRI